MSETNDESSIFVKINDLFNKLKKDKKALIIIITGIIGMLLIVFSGENDKKTSVVKNENNGFSVYDTDVIKQELTDLIESISGAGEAKVMITYKSDTETVFATDTDEVIGNDEIKTKKEYVIIKNNSEESGLPVKIIYPEVQGVAVICEGGDNQIIKEKIYSLVCALFSISSNSVSITAME